RRHPHLPGGRPHGRGAHRHHRQAQAADGPLGAEVPGTRARQLRHGRRAGGAVLSACPPAGPIFSVLRADGYRPWERPWSRKSFAPGGATLVAKAFARGWERPWSRKPFARVGATLVAKAFARVGATLVAKAFRAS